ncbi:protein crumbs homolog 2-like [Haliotis rufescens]|uniref:protein crumbs homolog 2-like n=1 Tax=Haliotis rufescens TaxID=6454 RepID=UPI00201ECC0F|nr:protein crumbs homolog 2-like [Haliotis rufescens]
MLNCSVFRLLMLFLFATVSAADVCKDSGNECLHGGTCDTTESPAECDCTATGGYTGDTCQIDPPPAKCTAGGKECLHGGTCDTTESPAECDCTATGGYTGDTCQITPPTSKCTDSGNECLHGGTCDTKKSPAVCDCTATGGYTGDTCENGAVVVRMSAYCVIIGLASYWITTWAHIV